MSRIKGKYVAMVTIEWDQEREPNMIPLQGIKDNARYLTMSLTEAIQDSVQENAKVEVVEQYCDFYEVEDDG